MQKKFKIKVKDFLTEAVENKKTTKVVVEKNVKKEKNYKYENIVFLGDSITDYYDLDKYYKNMPVINSGTAGYKTNQILDELDEINIKYIRQKYFYLLVQMIYHIKLIVK